MSITDILHHQRRLEDLLRWRAVGRGRRPAATGPVEQFSSGRYDGTVRYNNFQPIAVQCSGRSKRMCGSSTEKSKACSSGGSSRKDQETASGRVWKSAFFKGPRSRKHCSRPCNRLVFVLQREGVRPGGVDFRKPLQAADRGARRTRRWRQEELWKWRWNCRSEGKERDGVGSPEKQDIWLQEFRRA